MTFSVTESKTMKQLTKIIAVLLSIALFTACNGKAADTEKNTSSNVQTSTDQTLDSSTIQEKSENQSSGEATSEISSLTLAKQGNPDTVAWLRIPGTEIDNPVMQTGNNEDYLKKNENGKYDIWGCYFADYYSALIDRTSLTQNTVIYGHSESTENPDGKRFTQLFRYLDLDFMQKNPNIYLAVGEEELAFEVFAVFFTDTDFYYIDPNPSDQDFDAFRKTIAEKNEYIFSTDVTEQDRLLTLSACAYRYDTEETGNHRLVVMAKLLPEGIASSQVTVSANPSPKRP